MRMRPMAAASGEVLAMQADIADEMFVCTLGIVEGLVDTGSRLSTRSVVPESAKSHQVGSQYLHHRTITIGPTL